MLLIGLIDHRWFAPNWYSKCNVSCHPYRWPTYKNFKVSSKIALDVSPDTLFSVFDLLLQTQTYIIAQIILQNVQRVPNPIYTQSTTSRVHIYYYMTRNTRTLIINYCGVVGVLNVAVAYAKNGRIRLECRKPGPFRTAFRVVLRIRPYI